MGDRPKKLQVILREAAKVQDPPEVDRPALIDAIDRAIAAGARSWEERERILDRLDEVEKAGGPQRALLTALNLSKVSSTNLVLVLLERARQSRTRDPEACRRWAEAAVRKAETQRQPPIDLSVHARVWAEKGNAERIADDFPAARRSFDRAVALLEEDGGGDLLFRGEIFSLLASLEYAQHRPEEALACLEVAEECFHEVNQESDWRKVLLQRANVRLFVGDFEDALNDFKTVLASLLAHPDAPESQEQIQAACHDVLGAVTEIALTTTNEEEREQSFSRFLAVLPDVAGIYRQAPADWRVRLVWIMGRLFLAEGSLPLARYLLESALSSFLADDKPATAAVISLDLALVLAREGAVSRVREVASAACEVFQTSGLEADAWAAHRMLLDCDAATMEETIVDGLKKLRGASLRRTPDGR